MTSVIKTHRRQKATILNVYKVLNTSSGPWVPHIFTTLWLIMAVPNCQGKHGHRLPSDALRRQGRNAFVLFSLDLLIWWHWVITHPQGFLDLPPLPSLDMLSNPTSLILSDQRTKNVFHSLRNCGKQSGSLDFVLWTCLSTRPVL